MHLDRPADGIAPEQGALRSSQDFDAVDVDQVQHVAGGAADVNAVYVHRNTGVGYRRVICLPDSANEDLADGAGTGRRRRLVELQVRNDVSQLIHGMDLSRLEFCAGQSGHGDRNFLQTLFASPGGDDDVVDRLCAGIHAAGLVSLNSGKQQRRKSDR